MKRVQIFLSGKNSHDFTHELTRAEILQDKKLTNRRCKNDCENIYPNEINPHGAILTWILLFLCFIFFIHLITIQCKNIFFTHFFLILLISSLHFSLVCQRFKQFWHVLGKLARGLNIKKWLMSHLNLLNFSYFSCSHSNYNAIVSRKMNDDKKKYATRTSSRWLKLKCSAHGSQVEWTFFHHRHQPMLLKCEKISNFILKSSQAARHFFCFILL